MSTQQPSRRTIRLHGYDYRREGAYFVTICAWHRGDIFGRVKDDRVLLNATGRLVAATWTDIVGHHNRVIADVWLIMPDHVHGVITRFEHARGTRETEMARPGPPADSIGALVGAFKSATTRHLNSRRGTPGAVLWQRGYYEHVIRNDEEFERVRRYIAENPIRWTEARRIL